MSDRRESPLDHKPLTDCPYNRCGTKSHTLATGQGHNILPILSSARPCKTILISYYSVASTTSFSDDPATSRFFAVYRFRPIHPMVSHHQPVKAAVNYDIASSLQDRAKDILIVVAGLLFGLGCGAIAASTMYLVWSLFTNRSHFFGSSGDGYGSESDEESPKKMGYVKITPVPAAPAKEGYEG